MKILLMMILRIWCVPISSLLQVIHDYLQLVKAKEQQEKEYVQNAAEKKASKAKVFNCPPLRSIQINFFLRVKQEQMSRM